MEYIPAPNCASVQMIFSVLGQRVENVYHVRNFSPYLTEDLLLLGNWFIGWWTGNFQEWTPPEVSLVMVVCTALDTQTSPSIEVTLGLPAVGEGIAYTVAPTNVTCSVRWTTGHRGRSYRGRTFHVGLAKEFITGNTINSTPIGYLQAGYGVLINEENLLPGGLVILSKYANKAPREEAVATPVTGVFVDNTVDSQRRRLPGRGR